ncbi:MAG: hypothetical protein IPK53_08615 [bacterium]|nr:hypothetical protein [bacterium]
MSTAVFPTQELRAEYQNVGVQDSGQYLQQRIVGKPWELRRLLELAEVTASPALARQESRGGHASATTSERDDAAWLKHTLCHKVGEGEYQLDYKPQTLGRYEPKPRRPLKIGNQEPTALTSNPQSQENITQLNCMHPLV